MKMENIMTNLSVDEIHSGQLYLIQQYENKQIKTKVYVKICSNPGGKYTEIYQEPNCMFKFGFFKLKNCVVTKCMTDPKSINVCLDKSDNSGIYFQAFSEEEANVWFNKLQPNVTPTSSPVISRFRQNIFY